MRLGDCHFSVPSSPEPMMSLGSMMDWVAVVGSSVKPPRMLFDKLLRLTGPHSQSGWGG